MARRYPLLPLYEVRQLAQEKAETLVAQSAQACERAKQAQAAVHARLEAARERIAAAARVIQTSGERGPQTALELHRAESHRQSLVIQAERLALELNEAQDAVAQKQTALLEAERSLVRAKEELAVVEHHRTEYVAAQVAQQENREEEQASETWLARQGASKAES